MLEALPDAPADSTMVLKEDAVAGNTEAVNIRDTAVTTNDITRTIIKDMAEQRITSKRKNARKVGLSCGVCLSVHLPRLMERSIRLFPSRAE
jgi:hypothetical protein